MRTTDAYALECHACGNDVELPVGGPHACPCCGAAFDIQWRDELTPEQVRAMVEAAITPIREQIEALAVEAVALAAEERELAARLAGVRLEAMPVPWRWVM